MFKRIKRAYFNWRAKCILARFEEATMTACKELDYTAMFDSAQALRKLGDELDIPECRHAADLIMKRIVIRGQRAA